MKKSSKTITGLLVLLAVCMLILTNCTKKQQETPQNLDSLIDAKVEERLSAREAEEKLKATDLPQDKESIMDNESIIDEENIIDEESAEADDDSDDDIYASDETFFKGKIGPYPISMHLEDLRMTEEGDVVGYYSYDERPKSIFKLKMVKMEAINTKGSMILIMKEYSPSGKHTGTFNGQFECRGNYYAGTFTNSKGEKFHFELM